MALPIKGGKITTPFGKKGSMWSTGRHEGVDFAKPVGTPILACAPGQVIGTGVWGSAYGKNSVVIKHSINGQVLYTMYAHASKLYVKKGDKVKVGQHIADVGAEGNVTGPHLHLECQAKPTWTRGGGIDPKPLLDWQPEAAGKVGTMASPQKQADMNVSLVPDMVEERVQNKGKMGAAGTTAAKKQKDMDLVVPEMVEERVQNKGKMVSPNASAASSKIAKFIEIAKAEIGTVEGPKDNETKYGKFTKANFQPWCGSFVMWCANQAGVKLPGSTVYTPAGADAFKKVNRWFDVRKDDPQAGDIIYFDFPDDGVDRISHVGICIKNNGDGTIETVEGNTSGPKGDQRNGGMVLQKTRAYEKNNKKKLEVSIVGWGRPNWDATPGK